MCTIMSFDKKFYNKNFKAVINRIKQDAISNPDGFSLLTVGDSYEHTSLLRTSDVNLLIDVMAAQFDTGNAERAWVHARFATTGFVGLNGCHGFGAGKFTVFHNGIISRSGSDSFNVDSELIAWDIESGSVDEAIRNIMNFDNYANVFIVDNETGAWHVIRKSAGSLYTDRRGNYSTNGFGAINNQVPVNSRVEYGKEIVTTKRIDYYTGYYGNSWTKYDYSEGKSGEIDYNNSEYLDYRKLTEANTLVLFEAFAETRNWFILGIKEFVYLLLTNKQKGFCSDLGIQVAYDSNKPKDLEFDSLLVDLTQSDDFESFAELAEIEKWPSHGIPENVWDVLTNAQVKFANNMNLFVARKAKEA